MLASDDIKMMSLGQLDDAYRLSVIDDDTAVWGPGMTGWQPLGVVLGEDGSRNGAPDTARRRPRRLPPRGKAFLLRRASCRLIPPRHRAGLLSVRIRGPCRRLPRVLPRRLRLRSPRWPPRRRRSPPSFLRRP